MGQQRQAGGNSIIWNSFIESLHTIYFVVFTFILAAYKNLMPKSWQTKKSLHGKVILITGAGGGIGSELAKQLSSHNAQLLLWDNNETLLKKTIEQCRNLGATVEGHIVDITDRKNVYKIAEDICDKFGKVDILINNAAVLNPYNFMEMDDALMDKLVDVNVKSLFWVTKAFLPKMLKLNEGHIVCLSSASSIVGCPGLVDYSASKFAASGFMEALQHEMLHEGYSNLKFTTICPMFVRTPMLEKFKIFDSRMTVLSAEVVAEKIIEAVQLERQYVVIPGDVNMLVAIKGSEKFPTFDCSAKHFSIHCVPEATSIWIKPQLLIDGRSIRKCFFVDVSKYNVL